METRRKEGARLREPSARRAFPEVRVVSLVAGVHRRAVGSSSSFNTGGLICFLFSSCWAGIKGPT